MLDRYDITPRTKLFDFPELSTFPEVRRDFSSVIFDFDGTLVDSMWVWEKIDELFCKEHGLILPESYYADMTAMSFEQTARYFLEVLHVPMTVDDIADDFNTLAKQSYSHDVLCKTGVKNYLDVLKHRGVGLAIATSLSWSLLEPALKNNGLIDYFDDIAFCDESDGKSKPDVYLLAASRLGAQPDDCLVFEDIVPGILSAKKLGMTTCGVYDDHYQQNTESVIESADCFIQDYEDLLQVLR